MKLKRSHLDGGFPGAVWTSALQSPKKRILFDTGCMGKKRHYILQWYLPNL